MKIQILVDNVDSWFVEYAKKLENKINNLNIFCELIYSCKDIKNGDILFILGCTKILPKKYLKFHIHNIVVHESDLPLGRGWSPVSWQILEGKNKIIFTLFEAVEELDSGEIYFQEELELTGLELLNEIRNKQAELKMNLCLKFIKNYNNLISRPQFGSGSFFAKRTAEDSKIDINKSIKEQFNLFRICYNEKYPAFFLFEGKKYILKIFEDFSYENNNKNEN